MSSLAEMVVFSSPTNPRIIITFSEDTDPLPAIMDFANSSQAKQFMFSKEQLFEKREEAFSLAMEKFPCSLSQEEHQRYVNFYCNILLENAQTKLRFNRYQRFTALALMQRVYISTTIWEIPAPLAMICCLFLVSKFVKPVTLDQIINDLGYGEDFRTKFHPEDNVVKLEIMVLAAMDFKLRVHLPFHQITLISEHLHLGDEAGLAAFDILKTDALLLYPPGVIAIAAVSKVCGLDKALQALTDLEVPIPNGIEAAVEDILSLPYTVATSDEVSEFETRMGDELAVFHIIKKEQEAEDANPSAPTSLLPP